MSLNVNYGYCDLSISHKFDLAALNTIEKLGFSTVAINTYVEEAGDEPKKKKKKGDVREKQDFFPAPLEVADSVRKSVKFKILQRITIEFSDSSISHKMTQSENLKKFDIIAVVPKTMQAFQFACGTMDIDIITFEPETRLPFKVSRKLYRQAVDRGIFFELMYSQAIKDATSRKNIISTAHNYHAVGKSKNILLCSGAASPIHLRSTYDVVNLGFLFGLTSEECLEIIRNNPRRLILRAEGRKCGRLFVKLRDVSNEDDNKIPSEL